MTARDAVLVVFMALAVYLPKGLPVLLARERLPRPLERWLRYVAPAVLSALVAPTARAPSEDAAAMWRAAAYVVAFALALATRRMLIAAGGGLAIVALGAALGAL